jgi:L-ascorbate metabolism protein UlaG (beta-lactamase superfamily)
MTYTYLGHSSFLFDLDGVKIIFDPFISKNELAKGIDVNALRCDYVFLSHGHFDHVDDAETIARNSDAVVVGSYELAMYYAAKNLKHHPMNVGGAWNFGPFAAKCVTAVHSSVLPDGTYAGSPMGFIITAGNKKFYYSGDTALTLDMQLIGSYHQPDRAFISMGDNFTMGADDAIIATDFVKCNQITAMHFDTFPYIRINHAKYIEQFAAKGKTLVVPEIGKTYEL